MATIPKVLTAILAVLIGLEGCSLKPDKKELLKSGKQYLAKKDYGRASIQFRNAIQADPRNSEAHYLMALAQIELGDTILAYRELSRAIDLDPKNMEAQLKMAELLTISPKKEELEEAEQHAQTVLEASPDNPDALDALAVAELKLGNQDKSQELLERASVKAPEHLQTAVMLAVTRLRQNDKAGAEQVLKQAVEKAPGSLHEQVVLGAFYLVLGKNREAEQQFRSVLGKDPNNALALFDLAYMLEAMGRKDEAGEMYRQLSAGPAREYRPAYATYLFRTGKQKEAVAEFEGVARQSPNDIDLRTRLVAAYIATQQLDAARVILNAALAKNGKDSAALLQRSELNRSVGDYAEARSDLMKALRTTTDPAKAHFLLASIDRAERSPLKERQELNETLRLKPNFFPARIALAQVYMVDGDGRAALDLMNHTPDEQKGSLGFIEYRNWALWASGDFQEMRKGIDQGMAMARTPTLLKQDAMLNMKQGKHAATQTALFEVLKANPEDMGALEILLRSYGAQNRLPEAVVKVRALVDERPNSAPLRYRLGVLLGATGHPADARTAFAAAVSANPRYAPARLALARLDRAEGKTDAARQELEPLLSSKSSEVLARNELGFLEAKAGNYAKAIEHLRKVVEADPVNAIALNNLAYLLADHTDQTDEALRYAQMAKERAPNDATVDGTIGWAFFRKGMYSRAVQHLQSAVDAEGKNVIDGTAARRYHLAMAYMKIGDQDRAAKTLSAALRIDPNLPEAKVALEMQTASR